MMAINGLKIKGHPSQSSVLPCSADKQGGRKSVSTFENGIEGDDEHLACHDNFS
jgi:hypothetical protein